MSFVLHGIGVSSGIAIGRAQLVSHATLEAAHYTVTADQVAGEIDRLSNAIRTVQSELESLREEMTSDDAPAEFGAFLDVHWMILTDPTLAETPKRIIAEQRCNAEWALTQQTSVLIEQQVGIETVTHYCCRDRNLLGMLSDLLGAAAVGLRNLLLITGDPPKMGPYPNATAVFDIDAIGLTNLVSQLNRGLDPGGNAIGAPTRFTIGVGVNPAALDPAHELKRFEWKVEAGAEYAITQPVFDVEQLERFLRTIEHTRIPIVAGIWPLVSLRNAEFLANEVPGVVVPARIIERMRAASAKSKEHGVAEGIAIAREMLERVRPLVQGVQVSAPFGKVELALEVFRDTLAPVEARTA